MGHDGSKSWIKLSVRLCKVTNDWTGLDSGEEMVSSQTGCPHSILFFFSQFDYNSHWSSEERKKMCWYFQPQSFICVETLGWIQMVLLVGCRVVLYHLQTASFTSTQWGQMMLRKSREEDWCKVWGAFGISHGVQWVSARASALLDSLTRTPPESSTLIMAITGSSRDRKVKSPTLQAHHEMGWRHQWNRTLWLFRFTCC